MKKIILSLYIGCISVVVMFIVLYSASGNSMVWLEGSRQSLTQPQSVLIVEGETREDEPKECFHFQMTDSWVERGHLIFYAVHQDVKVTLGDRTLYQMTRDYKNAFGKTPGGVWVDIPIWPEYLGRELVVELTPVYAASRGYIPTFYVGERNTVLGELLSKESVTMLLCILCIIIGAACCFFIFINRKNTEIDKNPVHVGVFAMLVGTWKLTDLSILKLIASDYPGVYLIPFACLALMPVPFILYFQSLCKESRNLRVWYILCAADEIHCLIIITLQYFNVFDFKQTLYGSWLMIAVGLAAILIIVVKEGRRYSFSGQLKLCLAGVGLCIIGTIVDIYIYSREHMVKSSNYGILFFIAYIIIVCINIGKQALALVDVGQKTHTYQIQAFHDKLTGLYNRTALETDLQMLDFMDSKVILVTFDLNNLKKCNDTFGHEKGDQYIKDSAAIISECFSPMGKVYRVGGDEFNCLIENGALAECKKAVAVLRERCVDYDAEGKNPEIHMSIAVGYAMYDRRIDYSYTDTMKRADKMMYDNKAKLKLLEAKL